MKQDWNDIDDILYDGKKEEIEAARCPDCGMDIRYKYSDATGLFEIWCDSCGYYSRAPKSPKPNCVNCCGNENTLPINKDS